MKTVQKPLCGSAPFLAALIFLFKIATPVLARPEAPRLERFFPAGGQRGELVEVKAEGSFDRWPVETWVDRPGIEVSAMEEEAMLSIQVAPDAIPGRYLIRLHDAGGATSLRPFIVGTLPELVEEEPNNDPKSPQKLDSTRIVVNGRLQRNGDVDGYSVTLKAGEVLVSALQAYDEIGSPMDGVLQIVTSDGFVQAQEDDSPGLDPLLVFGAPADGEYIVRVFAFPETPTSTIGFAGGDAFVYRLTLTTGGYAVLAHPSVISEDETAEVELSGWNLPETAQRVTIPPEQVGADDDALAAFHPEVANVVPVKRIDHAALAEEDVAGPITRPVTISGRIDSPSQVDSYSFDAKKGESLVFRADAHRLGSPLDPVLRISDEASKTLSEEDDRSRQERDSTLTFKAPDDGTYSVSIQDLHGRGGPRFFYHLTFIEPTPSFALSTEDDHFEWKIDEEGEIEVEVRRLDNFAEAIEIVVEGLPEGVSAEAVTSEPKGDTSKQVKLTLKSEGKPVSGLVRIIGRGGDIEQAIDNLWLTVVEPSEEEEESEGDERRRRRRRDRED